MSTPQVIVLNNDIYPDYVEELRDITYEKTFDKMKLTSNQYTLPVLNRDNNFSINSPDSMFNGTDWLYTPIQIINSDGEYDFRGSLINIVRHHTNGKANFVLKDSFYKFRDEVIEYESSDWETGANAFKNLCEQVGYTDYNLAAYSKSDQELTSNSCKIKCNFNKSSNVKFQNAINKIAFHSNALVYSLNNEMHFEVWQYTTGSGVSFSVSDSDLKSQITVQEDESSMYTDYEISYYDDNGTPAIDSDNDNIGLLSRTKNGVKTFVLRSDNNSQVIFENLASAVYIGNGKIQRTHKNLASNPKPLSMIDFKLFKDFEDRLSLNTLFSLTYAREGWTNHVMEPFKYTTSESIDEIIIKAYEVPTA